MPTLRFSVDPETFDALVDHATRHLRPTSDHAAVLLRQALGLPFPIPTSDRQKSSPMASVGQAEAAR